MRVGEGVLANTGDQPRDLEPGRAAGDAEAVVVHLVSDVDGRGTADARQLVAEITIERFEPLRQLDDRLAAGVEYGDAIVDVLHVGALDGGVHEIFVRRIQRVIDFERLRASSQHTAHVHLAREVPRVTAAAFAVNRECDGAGVGDAMNPVSIHPRALAAHAIANAAAGSGGAGAADADPTGADGAYADPVGALAQNPPGVRADVGDAAHADAVVAGRFANHAGYRESADGLAFPIHAGVRGAVAAHADAVIGVATHAVRIGNVGLRQAGHSGHPNAGGHSGDS